MVIGKEKRDPYDDDHQEEFDSKNIVVFLIKLFMIEDMLPQVQDVEDAYIVRSMLHEIYKSSDKRRDFYLKGLLFLKKIEEGDSISEHFLKLKDIQDQLFVIGREVDEEDLIISVLNSRHSFENFVGTSNVTLELTNIIFERLCN